MKKTITGAITLLSAVVLTACSTGQENVLTSDAGNITQEQLYQALKVQSGSSTLQRLTITMVIEQYLGAEEVTKVKTETEKTIAEAVAQAGGEAQLLEAMAYQGITSMDMYKSTLIFQNLLLKAAEKHANFSEEELKAAYDKYVPAITVQHILISADPSADEATQTAAKLKAEALIKELQNGGDFTTLAQQNSDDSQSAPTGGYIGPFKSEQMVTEFSQAAYALQNVGDMTTEPVKTQFGYHIIKLADKPAKGTYEELHDTLVQELLSEKLADQTYIPNMVSELMKQANIQIHDQDLKTALDNFLKDPAAESSTEASSSEATSSESSSSESSSESNSSSSETTSSESSSSN